MWLLKQAYKAETGKDLERMVDGELSFKTKQMFAMALSGARQEDNVPVNHQAVEADVATLRKSVSGLGTDEISVCGILVTRSSPHLAAIAQAYGKHGGLSKMINSEFSGHMRDALLFIAEGAEHGGRGIERDAKLLEDSMKGAGTKDFALTYRIVSICSFGGSWALADASLLLQVRMSWNRPRWEEIKRCYQGTCSKGGLRKRVEGETSGDYERALVAIIG